MIQRTSFVFSLLATLGLAACGGASATPDQPASSSSDVVGGGGGAQCCDPTAEPPPGREGVWCCGDGSWKYDIGSGDHARSCGQNGGAGKVCNPPPKPKPTTCCPPTAKPPGGVEGAWCCADGSWQYDIGSGNQMASCGQHGGGGPICALGDNGEACGGPPPVALCAQCPGDDISTMFKWIDGKPTCECCNAAAPTCGPINGPITCATCKGGKNSYKYVNGKATCECCE